MGRISNEEKAKREAEGKPVVPDKDAIREPIKQMTGFSTEKEMSDALPTSTMTNPDGEAPKRTRRTKAEIAAARGGAPGQSEDDVLMQDPKYRKAVEKMRSMGISTTVKSGFNTAALATDDKEWELNDDEVSDVDDFSYVVSKKYPLMDPTRHWIGMAIYFFALLGTLIFKRAAKSKADSWMKKLHSWFGGDDGEKTAQEIEDEKAATSV